MIVESSFRDLSVGPDTEAYYNSFINEFNESWYSLLGDLKGAYVEGNSKDPLYYLFVKVVQIFSHDFTVLLLVAALIFYIPLAEILFRYVDDLKYLLFSMLFFIILFQIITLSGIRQQIATGFTFISFLSLQKNNIWKSCLFIIVAILFHISAFVFLLLILNYILLWKKIKQVHLISFIALPIILSVLHTIVYYFTALLANDYYKSYLDSSKNDAYTYFFVMEIYSIFAYLFIKKDFIIDSLNIRLLYCTLPLATVFIPFILLNGTFIRIGQYFNIYALVLMPQLLNIFSKKYSLKSMPVYLLIILSIIYILNKNVAYSFIWNT